MSDVVRDDALAVRARHPDSRSAMAEIVGHLGHQGGNVVQTVSGNRWFSYCGCGFVSSTSISEPDALGKLVHHLRLVAKAWRQSGLPLLATRPAPAPDWLEVRRRNPHFDAFCAANEELAARLPEIVGGRP